MDYGFNSHVLICLSMDKWVLRGHLYSYVKPVSSFYNIGQFLCNCTSCILGRASRIKKSLPDFR